jgi:hypothetical protein
VSVFFTDTNDHFDIIDPAGLAGDVEVIGHVDHVFTIVNPAIGVNYVI